MIDNIDSKGGEKNMHLLHICKLGLYARSSKQIELESPSCPGFGEN